MQRFMAALKLAFDTKSTRLDLVAGQKFAIESPKGLQEHDGSIDASLVGGIMQNLFQNKMPTQIERAKLSIKGVGEFPVIAYPNEKKLSIFFGPAGLQQFTKSWADLQGAVSPVAQAPIAPKSATVATPIGVPKPAEAVSQPQPPQDADPAPASGNSDIIELNKPLDTEALTAHQHVEESKILQAPKPPLEDIGKEEEVKMSAAPKKEVKAEPVKPAAAEVKPAGDRLTSLEDAFDSGDFNAAHEKKEDDDEGDSESAKTGMNRMGGPDTQMMSVMMVAPPAEEAPKKIFWGANKPGMSSISDGENEIDDILKQMFTNKASDLHLAVGNPIMFRIDGEIERIGTDVITAERMEALLTPIIPKMNYEEFLKDNDTDFAYEIRGLSRFRVNMARDHQGVACIMRIIPQKILTLQDLKTPPVFLEFAKLSKGLVLVTGPTGSGKSTTLAAIVDWVNKNRAEHIITIEDPVEFTHQQHMCTVTHREVGKHTNSFKRALRGALRQDPDIVLVGELRDLETVAIAIETAETGHLVFGTLHTNTAISTVDRIIDQFPSEQQGQIRMMLSNSLKGVIAQSLVKKIGGGRVAAHEILYVNDAVANLIREGKTHMIGGVMQGQKQFGNILMDESLMNFVLAKQITPEDAFIKSIRKQDFKEELAAKGIKLDLSAVGDADPDHKPNIGGATDTKGKAGAPQSGGMKPPPRKVG